jgi:tetratricopeptide (TPR) repeat protein
MKTLMLCLSLAFLSPWALADGLQDDVQGLQRAWEEIKYRKPEKDQAGAYEALAKQAGEVRARYAGRAEPEIWYGIIVASEAGAKGGFGALKLAKEAKKALEHALAIDAAALQGSAYTSLGSLYYQVPGWPLGFGDERKARELLERALAINPQGIDPNYFLGDFLYRKGDYEGARAALERALRAPARPDRPLADEGRRREIESLLQEIRARSG